MNSDFTNKIRVENTTQQIIETVDKQYKKKWKKWSLGIK